MGIKKFKPTSDGVRFRTNSDFADVTASTPEKSLLAPKHQKGGRNNHGRITVRHKGGGNKQKYRLIDFKRNKDGIALNVKTIEYDPNRSARIALVAYIDGEKRYILAPIGLKVGDKIESGAEADIKLGNAKMLKDMPVGTVIHNVEMRPEKAASLPVPQELTHSFSLKREPIATSVCRLVRSDLSRLNAKPQ